MDPPRRPAAIRTIATQLPRRKVERGEKGRLTPATKRRAHPCGLKRSCSGRRTRRLGKGQADPFAADRGSTSKPLFLPPRALLSRTAADIETARPRQRGSHRLAVQDVALSRRKQGFESPWERHFSTRLRTVSEAADSPAMASPRGALPPMMRTASSSISIRSTKDRSQAFRNGASPVVMFSRIEATRSVGFPPKPVEKAPRACRSTAPAPPRL